MERLHRPCKHTSSRNMTALGMRHTICNGCGTPLQSPDLIASIKEYQDVEGEKALVRDARKAVKLTNKFQMKGKQWTKF